MQRLGADGGLCHVRVQSPAAIQIYLGLMQDCNNDALRNQILEDYVLVRHSQDMLNAAE